MTNNFYIPMDKPMPKADEKRDNVIPYYQWVPLILLLQALLFYLPSVFWHGFWMVFVGVMMALGFVVSFVRALVGKDRITFVKDHFGVVNRDGSMPDDKIEGTFINEYLAQDGSFVLRLIAHNTNSLNVKDILRLLWYQKDLKEEPESDYESESTSEDSRKKNLIS